MAGTGQATKETGERRELPLQLCVHLWGDQTVG
jgi:hypothetical protein